MYEYNSDWKQIGETLNAKMVEKILEQVYRFPGDGKKVIVGGPNKELDAPFITYSGIARLYEKYNKTCDDFEDEVKWINTSKWKNTNECFNNSCDNKDFTDKFLWVTPGSIKKG